MRKLTLAALIALAIFPAGARAQATAMGATVASGGACPSTSVLAAGNNRPVYANASGGLCIVTSPGSSAAVPSTNIGSTVTLGGTYQTVLAASTSRKGCVVQNPVDASETLNVKVGTATPVFTLSPGGSFSCTNATGTVISDLIAVTAATTGHSFAGVSQ